VSASTAKPKSELSQNGNAARNRGAVCYRPNDKGNGWEKISPESNNNQTAFASNLLSTLSSYRTKDMTNIQDIPFIHHFLPANYPHSVCPSYTQYASYCFAGSIAGSAAMVLSTQALLVAVGVGTQSAAPMAAALNWVMKDGVGQLGVVIFASQLGKGGIDVGYWRGRMAKLTGRKYSKGNFQTGTADSNPKRWRMVAAIALDASTLLEICTPMMGPQWFLPCASVANIGKNVGFLAASASRAAIHQSLCMGGSISQAKTADGSVDVVSTTNVEKNKGKTNTMNFNNNLGDVTAKSGSQAIVASLFGTALGILLSQTFCSDHGTSGILAGFIVLSAVHQVCTFKALRAVPLKSLDRHRLHIVLNEYIKGNREAIFDEKKALDQFNLLSPMQVSEIDFFLPLIPPDESANWLTIGAPLLEVCPFGADELESLLIPSLGENLSNIKYILKVKKGGNILLTFLESATENDILKGMFHAYIAHEFVSELPEQTSSRIIKKSLSITNLNLQTFISHLKRTNWEVGSGYVNVECGSSHRIGIELA
jgi:hypothetical protein